MRLTTLLALCGVVGLLWLFEIHKRISWQELARFQGWSDLQRNAQTVTGYVNDRVKSIEPSSTPSPDPNQKLMEDPNCYDARTKQRNPSCNWQAPQPQAGKPDVSAYANPNVPYPQAPQPSIDPRRDPDWMMKQCQPGTVNPGSRLKRDEYDRHLTQTYLGQSSPLLSNTWDRYCVDPEGGWVFIPEWLDGMPEGEESGYRLHIFPDGSPDLIEKPIGGRYL